MEEETLIGPPITLEEAIDRAGNGRYNYLLVATCSLILMGVGVDLFGFGMVVAVACDLKLTVSQKGILTSLPYIGIMLTSFVWGYVSDIRGRKFTLAVPLMVSFVLSCATSLAPYWLFLGFIKFLSICFSCAANSASYTLVGESCMLRMRSKYMLLLTCLLILSPAVASMLSYPTLSLRFSTEISWLGINYTPWRLLILVYAFPLGIGGLILYFFFESPKFLYYRGRKEEAMDVLKKIYSINHKGDGGYQMSPIVSEIPVKTDMPFFRAMFQQIACLFKPPLLRRSLQLYYIVALAYITNNSFLVWLPHVMTLVKESLNDNNSPRDMCSLISGDGAKVKSDICHEEFKESLIYTLMTSQSIFAIFNFIISFFPKRRKGILIAVLAISAFSAATIPAGADVITCVIFFMAFTSTCLAMGILASYFVDLYPTTHRGMATCLSIMIGRSCSFFGINLVGSILFSHCKETFYFWSLLVFSGVVPAWFLPQYRTG